MADVAPTILDLARLPDGARAGMDGRSLAALVVQHTAHRNARRHTARDTPHNTTQHNTG